mmetsp:Transcript_84205/g.133004  ORF Transcript_84205/g.133004 Transcript_84205/m.133004 type:complete len:201 (+) Transcript_84205:859-1461(+)
MACSKLPDFTASFPLLFHSSPVTLPSTCMTLCASSVDEESSAMIGSTEPDGACSATFIDLVSASTIASPSSPACASVPLSLATLPSLSDSDAVVSASVNSASVDFLCGHSTKSSPRLLEKLHFAFSRSNGCASIGTGKSTCCAFCEEASCNCNRISEALKSTSGRPSATCTASLHTLPFTSKRDAGMPETIALNNASGNQ